MSKTPLEIAEILANDAEDHWRFMSASRKKVAVTALHDVLNDLVPLVPWLTEALDTMPTTAKEYDHIAGLLDTLNR